MSLLGMCAEVVEPAAVCIGGHFKQETYPLGTENRAVYDASRCFMFPSALATAVPLLLPLRFAGFELPDLRI